MTIPTDTATAPGRYERRPSTIRHRITSDGSSGFPAEPGRYRLYVSYACPWAHRTLIARALLGLDDVIPLTVVDPVMDGTGWRLEDGTHLIDVYCSLLPGYEGRATVPLLVDEHGGVAVSNESADIMRMLGDAFGGSGPSGNPFVPACYAADIERFNATIQTQVNEAVYRVGFARSDEARREATTELLDAFNRLDDHLGSRRFLIDDAGPVETDWRLWTTLVRYDPVYRPLFLGGTAPALSVYANLARFADDLMQVPGIAATFRVDEVVLHFTARVARLKQGVPARAG